ncbi:hypothetical protein MML48_4g00017738 [Holotrichia oblita]|uniref:Uncharacterized protein n=1 Tax=Holotrichia oblita TaxID=644536 RepID=A0ACB9TB74_HOLOL|nr:hypothetical protein MML48_4g00017738 [Holotrichia oblita]
MHKITKGLKKKKKGKKSKHKEEELFKPEELEAYRREHQQVNETSEEASASAENEEWKKFNALTAGIDTILKKTQGDLDRIKSTSFFQRVPPPSEVKKKKEEERIRVAELEQQKQEEKKSESFAPEAAIVQVSESESEDEEEDDIFDTGYIDAIASGEVKLVHIPDSPQEELEGDDPFDTSIAERAILGPSVDKREETFDENSNATQEIKVHDTSSQNKVTLLDDDAPSDLLNTPIDLSQNLQLQLATTPVHKEAQEAPPTQFNILEEFDNAAKKAAEDDEDDEFALLAAESLNKKAVVNAVPVRSECGFGFGTEKESWSAFGEAKTSDQIDDEFIIEDDPFDTTFAENILPGKAELKIIEDEILNTTEEPIQNKVSIQIVNPVGQQESFTVGDRVSEQRLNLIQPHHRDLLGGSSTDLSKLGDQPLQPKETVDQDYIEYCDPFDTSLVETAKLPGQTELKFLERELLGEIKQSLNDDTDFNPRIDEDSTERQQNRKVSFDLPLDQHQNLLETGVKIAKPLTPYYIRENSIPEIEEIVDPFDTSFVCEVAPGKAELKLIENELFEKDTILDSNFDPRDDKQVAVAKVVETIQGIVNPACLNTEKKVIKTLDLLVDDHDVQAKVLTPATEKAGFDDYVDPFDTSIACNILPGKTELKLIESELINQEPPKIYNLDAVLKTQLVEEKDFFEENDQTDVNVKTLTPILDRKSELDSDIDPFDTSIASNIGLGKTELKILESELI